MARKRPSSHKREREIQKRHRELKKAQKAARRLERKTNSDRQDPSPRPNDVEGAADADVGDSELIK
ncbi:MAG: hypothetical protein JXQ75_00805 [Phycisphaerae bacterium]|nr:hypothetical protein [Phycisphaerae bacterium]